MTLSFIIPVVGLSIFPHQEPRFITPILLPLIFLYSHLVRDFEEHCKIVVPFRKRHPKRKQISGIFKYPLKCIDYFERATENFDNRYNISGRYLTNLKRRELIETNCDPKPASFTPTPETWEQEKPHEEKKQEEPKEPRVPKPRKKYLLKLWYLCNGFCVLFYGFVHQGGVYDLSKDFYQKLLVKPKYTTYHLVTSHIYSFPLHLLLVKRNYRYKNTNFLTYEMGSDNLENINLKLLSVLRLAEEKKKSVRRNYRLFYAFPTSFFNEFRYAYQYYSTNYTYEIREIFYPHFSTEALPNLALNITEDVDFNFSKISGIFNLFDCFSLRYFLEFLHQFGLMMIEIKLPS